MTTINTEFETMEFRVQPPTQRKKRAFDVGRMFAKLVALTYPKQYRDRFLELYEDWRYEGRPEGGLYWARAVFAEYVYPGYATIEAMKRMEEEA